MTEPTTGGGTPSALPYPELLALIEERSAAFRKTVAAAPDLRARVPGCPEWSLRDLVAHLGDVHRSWAAAVAAGPSDAPPTEGQLGDLAPHGDLLAWSAESTGLLLAALRAADPARGCWTWWGGSGAPQTVGAVARHQLQEAAVHTYDAQEAAGRPEPVPTAVALDGIPEFLTVSLGTAGPWPHAPASVVLATAEGPAWTLSLPLSPPAGHPPAGGPPAATLRGPAGRVLLALHRRVPYTALDITGDHATAARLIAWPDLS
ncbi:maleylpyruvate isomerase family mycothiol-dependent enzyme [Streptomyces aidingensis]|uniref:TIGR03083 family protein n=1 Tax=Streptomyces aidingensis TaxID=910347 RepID=A0A1I1H4A9_9ACTN|nr:maleylpyruvate isomerase family mycothiol-dependent enzyme [Streptomyces aidingensis]SFC16918.1 TIGR03083 family protein [Streptomyces aidingensis]